LEDGAYFYYVLIFNALGSGVRISRFADPTGTVYRFLIALLIYMIGGFPTLVYALPHGGTISSGAGTIDTSGLP